MDRTILGKTGLALLVTLLYLMFADGIPNPEPVTAPAALDTGVRQSTTTRAQIRTQSSSISQTTATHEVSEPVSPADSLVASADAGIELALDLVRASEALPADIALDRLRPLFWHPQAAVRLAAYEALADMKHPERMPILGAALTDAETDIRILALGALASTGHSEALPHIESALTDPDPEVRISAIDALVDLETTWVIPGLSAILFDPDTRVRRQAVAALGEIGGEDTVVYLLQARYDPDQNTRNIARVILHEMGENHSN